MKRKNRFLIAIVSAAITFGSLMAIAGPARFNRGHGCSWHERHMRQCENFNDNK